CLGCEEKRSCKVKINSEAKTSREVKQSFSAAGTKLQLLKGYNCSRIKTAEKIKIDWRSRILT
ncbi:hypothetical protein Tco_1286917, partial [Tanacetum coccineum]